MALLQRAARFAALCRRYGPREAAAFVRLRHLDALRAAASRPGPDLRVLPASLAHPVAVRRQTTDVDVYVQVLHVREYGCLDDLDSVGLILDCGANVGYTSAYLLARFPQARAVAVEPDADNFAALALNLAPYADRVTLVQAGVWSHDVGLVVEGAGELGGEWSRRVRPSRDGEATDVRGVSIGSLLAQSGAERISILKVDIEGAEAVVFGSGAEAWIGRVDAIAIELHEGTPFGDTSGPFYAAIREQGFQVSHSGELTVCLR